MNHYLLNLPQILIIGSWKRASEQLRSSYSAHLPQRVVILIKVVNKLRDFIYFAFQSYVKQAIIMFEKYWLKLK